MVVVIVIDLVSAPAFMHADRNGRIIGIHQSRAHTCGGRIRHAGVVTRKLCGRSPQRDC